MNAIKFLPYAACILFGVVAGAYVFKVAQPQPQQPPPCPACNCPAAVSLQNFDLDKLNNKRGTFTYSPQLHDVRLVIESKDSLLLKSLLRSIK